VIVTKVQEAVLLAVQLKEPEPKYKPRSSLERLEKKGLVEGNRKDGWRLTDKGRLYVLSLQI